MRDRKISAILAITVHTEKGPLPINVHIDRYGSARMNINAEELALKQNEKDLLRDALSACVRTVGAVWRLHDDVVDQAPTSSINDNG